MANDNRFAILLALQKEEANVSELCERLGLEQSHVSHSLRRLVEEKLVSVKSEGPFRVYSIPSEPISGFLNHIQEFCDMLATEEASELMVERAKRETIAAALRERETELASILDHAPITISLVDRAGTYVAIAGELVRRFGRRVEDVVGKNLVDLYPEGSTVRDSMGRAMQGEEVRWTLESNGYTFETFSLPIRDAAGEVDRVLSVTVNATEWLRVKKPGVKLDDLEFLVDEIPAPRLTVDRNAVVQWVNRFAREAVPGLVPGAKLSEVFPASAERFDAEMRYVLNSGERREMPVVLSEVGSGASYLLRMAPVWQHSHVCAVALFFIPAP
jgi:PAS domain S-box-containing protein